ncbi:MAG: glycoside hydrolase family 3 C-terminal domain-containing protein [Atopobiaceae bacterium]|nr:glycoside hydrolase family 3 C-terminal domain-containing protein [Atopobiaceae bacterium]
MAKISTARKVGRVIKTILKAVVALVLAGLMVVMNVIVPGMGMISRMANNMLGYEQSWTTPEGAEDVDAQYYKSDFTEEEIADAEHALDYAIASEGYVLLKNDDATMPFAQGTMFSFFSENVRNLTATQSIMTQFTGASGDQNLLVDAFEAKGLHVNQELMDFYTQGAGAAYAMGSGSINFGEAEDFRINECPLSELQAAEGVLESAQDTVPVFVWRRVAGEGRDMPRSMYNHADNPDDQVKSYIEPDTTELEILQYLNDNYDDVVLIVNTASALELDWVADFPSIKAILFVPSTGTFGTEAIADIFAGNVNPSGHTVDTFVSDALASPAAQNYGDYAYVDENGAPTGYNYVSYLEGIYVGYRYYETRYEDAVLGQGNAGDFVYADEVVYPFGHGLSYTTFEWGDLDVTWDGLDSITAKVTVTNTGDVAGKDAVQIYAQAPYTTYDQDNGIEKAAVSLVAYEKTKLLEPGESQTLEIAVDPALLASFDAHGAGTYVIENGTYYITAGQDAHDAVNNILAAKGKSAADGMDAAGNAALAAAHTVAIDSANALEGEPTVDATTFSTDAYTGNPITAVLGYAEPEGTQLTRADWEGTFPAPEGTPIEGEISTWGNAINGTDAEGNPASLVWGKPASAELLAQLDSHDSLNPVDDASITDEPVYGAQNGLSLIDMRGLAYDDPAWDVLLDQLTAEDYAEIVGHSGYGSEYLTSVGKPFVIDADTAAGLIYGSTGMMFCSPVVMAQTWNQELAEQYGRMLASEANLQGMSGAMGWYAPSMNIHRTQFIGRAAEYYSEDPIISGTVAAHEVHGAAELGFYSMIKHFAFNDQENHRGDGGVDRSVATWVGEQAAREIYLRPFELCMHAPDVEETYYAVDESGTYTLQTRTQRTAQGIMTAFNRLGATWTGGSYPLIQQLVRDEWGFDGFIITDSANAGSPAFDQSQMIRAGADAFLRSNANTYLFDPTNAAEYHYAREAAHHLLYTTVNCRAMNGAVPGSVYKPGMQPLDKIRLAVNVLGGGGIGAIAITGWLNHLKRKKERLEAAAEKVTQA